MTNATRKTLIDVHGTLVRAGWGEPDDRGDEPTAPDHETAERPSAVGQSKVTSKASLGKVEGRRLYLSEDVHFRLRMYAYQKGQKLSEAAEELLDRGLPKWDVNRVG